MRPVCSAYGSGRVLVVEDGDAIRRALVRLLGRAGYQVEDAPDFETARGLLAEQEFDAVATDIVLPGEDGMSLLRLIEHEHPGLPVVLMTGAPQLDTAIDAIKCGAFSYLTKPFDLEEFLEVIGRAVRSHRFARSGAHPIDAAAYAELEQRFERTLASMYIAYQPIVSVADRTVAGYEALMRGRAPGFESPRDILAAAEQLDGLWAVGRRVRELVAERLTRPHAPARVFVNVHPHELLDEQLYSPSAPLTRHADRVTLEITERETLQRVSSASMRIAALRELGYLIAVDDLGSGYSSLTCMAALAPDFVKIDQALIRDVHCDATKSRMVSLLAQLCHEMGATVVAEGIETEQERDRLIELGCDLLQGYLLGYPCAYLREDEDRAHPRLGLV